MPNFQLDMTLRFDTRIECDNSSRAEEIAEELIEKFYEQYDGIKEIEIIDWDVVEW